MSKRPKEPWKTDPERLRRNFDVVLKRVWEKWGELGEKGTPFGDVQYVLDLDLSTNEIVELYFEVGWARGVSEAEGWSLNRPGPKEWSPKDEL